MAKSHPPVYSLGQARHDLMLLEDRLVLAFIRRSRFKVNPHIYSGGGKEIFDPFLLVGDQDQGICPGLSYPTRQPFSPIMQPPFAESEKRNPLIVGNPINLNSRIVPVYLSQLPYFCECGDDQDYKQVAEIDIACLRLLSERVHSGVLVAEAKYRAAQGRYNQLVSFGFREAVEDRLRDRKTEGEVLARVRQKARSKRHLFNATAFEALYRDHIIPMTIEAEVEHIFRRAN